MNDSIVGINQPNKIQVLPLICDVELEPVKTTINKVDDSNRLVLCQSCHQMKLKQSNLHQVY